MNNYQILSKNEIENSIFTYNTLHLTTIDFDHPIHLLQQFNAIEDIKYILGILISIASIYYFIKEIIKNLNPRY